MAIKSYHILIIDDDELDRERIERLLNQCPQWRIKTRCATTGQEALALYTQAHFDCILLDYTLPDTNGLEFIKTLKHLHQQAHLPPIIMLTGFGNESIAVAALQNGALDYLNKNSLTQEKLVQQIESAITLSRKQLEDTQRKQALEAMALLDSLTQLPNRHAFEETFERFIRSAERYNRLSALLFIDINKFKKINDTMGHDVGDELLIAVANRLKQGVRQDDFTARLGGDEFAIILNQIPREHDAGVVAKKILTLFEDEISLSKVRLSVSLSIGITCFVTHTKDAKTLLQQADIAMYQAKRNRESHYVFYEKILQEQHVQRLQLEQALLQCIKEDQLFFLYQPLYHLKTNEIKGLEVLLRWHCPTLGQDLTPSEFLPLAKSIGIHHQISCWVLEQISLRMKHWQTVYAFQGSISTNISLNELLSDAFLAEVKPYFLEQPVSDRTHFELHEDLFHHRPPQKLKTLLTILQQRGINLQIDDFCTGFQALSRLQELAISRMKIEGGYIQKLGNTTHNDIVKSIIALASALKLTLIAENIEMESQREFLLSAGCELGYGPLFSQPLTEQEVQKYLCS